MGQCFMASVAMLDPDGNKAFRKAISAKSGVEIDADEFPIGLGKRILQAEREFNQKAGFTQEDDRLPEMFTKEPLPPHDTVFTIGNEEIDATFDF
jgi:aldehyde:ferredoxin oxidoreductase